MKTTKELIIADITAKVEAKLASQKVELSLMDDLKKITDLYIKKINPDYDLIEKERSKIAGEIVALKAKATSAYALWNDIKTKEEPIAAKFFGQAKELGIDAFTIKEYDQFNDVRGYGHRAYKTYEYIKDIKLP
jgi:hypothetical protein